VIEVPLTRRRSVLLSAAAAISGVRSTTVHAQDLDYDDYDGPLPTYRLFGTDPAAPEEVEQAKTLLAAAPRTKGMPNAVAQYFEGLKDVNKQGERYNAQWAQRWNPVIFAFYKTTKLEDKYLLSKGDTIHWCAAFMNWCLEAAGCRTTNSASSSSFRGHGKKTTKPTPGDLVVFKHADAKLADEGRGHVAFFIADLGDRIKVLGGNQSAGKRYSSVNTSDFKKESQSLIFHSYRSIGSLRKAG
jgi:uncharacterized protein (TIGR02594 family)